MKKYNFIRKFVRDNFNEVEEETTDYVVKCCFHSPDKTPSLRIHKQKGYYHCFPCGEKGSLQKLVAYIKGITYTKAGKLLSGNIDIKRLKGRWDVSKNDTRIDSGEIKPLKRYNLPKDTIRLTKRASIYLQSRGLKFKVIHDLYCCKKGFYKGRIITPILDEKGKLVCFEARKYSGRIEGKKVLYPKHSPISNYVFNLNNIKKEYVIVVEGIVDCLKVKQMGLSVVSIFGTQLSSKQAELLSRFKRIYICFDGDEAGRKKSKELYKDYGDVLPIRIVRLPLDLDPKHMTKKGLIKLCRKENIPVENQN